METFFAKRQCSNCNRRISIHSGVNMSGQLCLCNQCAKIIPKTWYDCVSQWDLLDYRNFIAYMDDEKNRADIFTRTKNCNGVILDEEHGLFYISQPGIAGLIGQPRDGVIYDLKYLHDANFLFYPDTVNNSFVGVSISGKLEFEFETLLPRIHIGIILSTAYRCKAERVGKINTRIDYHMPKETDEFHRYLVSAAIMHQNKQKAEQDATNERIKKEKQREADENQEKRKCQDENWQKNSKNFSENFPDSAYFEARALFMLPDGQPYTEEDIKRMRNRLIKAFHTDNGEENEIYAQKINTAYVTLKQHIGKN